MGQEESKEKEHGSLSGPTLRAIFWLTATRGIKAPLTLVAVAVLARILTPAEYGIVAIAMVVATFSDTLVDGSFGMVLIQRKELSSSVIGATFLLSVALAGIFAGGIAILAPLIEREFNFPELRNVLLALAAMLPVTAVTTVTGALLQRSLQFGLLSVLGLVSQLIYIIAAIALALAGMGLWSLVWAQMLQWAVDAILELLAVRNRYRLALSVSGIREVLGTGGMFTISKVVQWAANSADRLVIGRMLGAAELGFYTRAATLLRTVRQLAGAGPMRVLFSSFSKMQHDPVRMGKAYERSLSLSLIASVLVSAFFFVNADLVVRILLGPRWLQTVPLVQILFFGFIPKSAAFVAEAVPLALGLSRAAALREAVQLTLVAVGAIIGSEYGIVGAAAGVCAAYWLFYIACILLVQRLLHPSLGAIARVHFNSLAVAIPPLVLSLAVRWLLPSDSLLAECVPAVVFGAVALFVLAFAPASLVSGDIAQARGHLRARLRPFVTRTS